MGRRIHTAWRRAGWLAACGLLAACGTKPTVPAAPGRPRIVSFSPALTRTAADLGLASLIVGRTPFCTAVPATVPVAGDLQRIDYETLLALAPTHILVQPPATGIDPALTRLADEHGWRVGSFSHINTLDDVEEVVRAMPALFDDPAVAALAATLLNDLARALAPPGPDAWQGSTMLVYGDDPVRIFGRGTYLHEMLERLGGRNAATADGWTELTLEDVTWLDPGAIIVVGHEATAGPLRTLDVDAVRSGRIVILDDPDAMLPSTGLVGVARKLRSLLITLGGTSE